MRGFPRDFAMSSVHVSHVHPIDAVAASTAEEDNGFADLAETDVASCSEGEGEGPSACDELTFAQKLAVLEETVVRHPLNREILYKTLAFCREERPLRAVECEIATYPEFALATQNQYHMVSTLVQAHGLRLVERDEQGAEVLAQQKEGLTEDEVDDLVCSLNYVVTEVGLAFVEQHSPRARIIELMSLAPERRDTYVEVLEFVAAGPRSYNDIQKLLKGHPALETVIDGQRQTMQPSVFVDKLERNGALVWHKGWCLTEEGEEFLKELKASK